MSLSLQKITDLHKAHKRLKVAAGELGQIEKLLQEVAGLFTKHDLDASDIESLGRQCAAVRQRVEHQAQKLTPSGIPILKTNHSA